MNCADEGGIDGAELGWIVEPGTSCYHPTCEEMGGVDGASIGWQVEPRGSCYFAPKAIEPETVTFVPIPDDTEQVVLIPPTTAVRDVKLAYTGDHTGLLLWGGLLAVCIGQFVRKIGDLVK